MPLFEVAVLKKKDQSVVPNKPEKIHQSITPIIAADKEHARDQTIAGMNIASENISDYEVLVRPFV